MLGHRSVAECQRCVSSDEFVHWLALDSIDPLPDRRGDYYMAQIALMLGSRWRAPKSPSLDLSDFLLFQDIPPASPDEVESNIRAIFGGMATRKAS